MYYLYILQSLKDGSFYIGTTNDLNQRLKRHKQGSVKFTKSRIPINLVYFEKFTTRSEAYRRESQIKRWKKRRAIENLINRSAPPSSPDTRHTVSVSRMLDSDSSSRESASDKMGLN